jgi:hypothetical protein
MGGKINQAHKKQEKRNADWRQFEKLVALIEETLCPVGAVVRSPDRILDLVTGKKREVDASIRYKVGSTPILITVECRKRGTKQDDTWLEQLATKKEKVGAAKTIAVSSKGFSASSLKTAEMKGIEARQLTEITAKDISEWCQLEFIHYVPPSVTILEVRLVDDAGRDIRTDEIDDSVIDSLRALNCNAPLLECARGTISPNDMVNSWQKEFAGTELDMNYGVTVGSEPVRRAFLCPVATGDYWLKGKQGRLAISAVGLIVDVKLEVRLIPINRTYRYRSPDEKIVDGVEFVIPDFDSNLGKPLHVVMQSGPGFGLKATFSLGDGTSQKSTKTMST